MSKKIYTKKEILDAFYNWEVCSRLEPTKLMTDEEILSYDAKEMAKIKTNELISHMK